MSQPTIEECIAWLEESRSASPIPLATIAYLKTLSDIRILSNPPDAETLWKVTYYGE